MLHKGFGVLEVSTQVYGGGCDRGHMRGHGLTEKWIEAGPDIIRAVEYVRIFCISFHKLYRCNAAELGPQNMRNGELYSGISGHIMRGDYDFSHDATTYSRMGVLEIRLNASGTYKQ